MEAVQVRVTGEWCDLSGVIDSLCELAKKYIVFRHTDEANRPHYHVYLFETTKKEDTLRNRMKESKILKTDWSIKTFAGKKSDPQPISIAGACKYGSKGKYDPVKSKGISDDMIKVGKSLGYCKNHDVEKNSKAEVHEVKAKRLTKLDLVAMLDDEIRSHDGYDESKVYPFSFYTDKASKMLIRERQAFSMYKAIELFEIWMMYHDRPTWNRYASDILEKRYGRS